MTTALPGIIMISSGVLCYLFALCWNTRGPQHAGGREGALPVWQLIAHVEAERQREATGRHRLREPRTGPPSTQDDPAPPTAEAPTSAPPITAPPVELQRRVLDALRRL